MFNKLLDGKNILVTGGTGSFGHQIIDELLKYSANEIVIFSRDEDKQYRMKLDYGHHSHVKFMIGDVRDNQRLHKACRGIDLIFHAAALKQVPSNEDHPLEAVKTNIEGAYNVTQAAIDMGVKKVVAVSTDKAVKPVNVMGMTKAIQERIMLSENSNKHDTQFVCVRYGNVVGSRGSVVPLFKKKIDEGKPLPITDQRMTRYLLTLPESIDLVFTAAEQGRPGDLFVKKMPASTVVDLARVMGYELGGRKDYPVEFTGIRPGEKIHEVLVSEEELIRTKDIGNYYVIVPYWRAFEVTKQPRDHEYTSENTERLDHAGISSVLKRAGWLK